MEIVEIEERVGERVRRFVGDRALRVEREEALQHHDRLANDVRFSDAARRRAVAAPRANLSDLLGAAVERLRRRVKDALDQRRVGVFAPERFEEVDALEELPFALQDAGDARVEQERRVGGRTMDDVGPLVLAGARVGVGDAHDFLERNHQVEILLPENLEIVDDPLRLIAGQRAAQQHADRLAIRVVAHDPLGIEQLAQIFGGVAEAPVVEVQPAEVVELVRRHAIFVRVLSPARQNRQRGVVAVDVIDVRAVEAAHDSRRHAILARCGRDHLIAQRSHALFAAVVERQDVVRVVLGLERAADRVAQQAKPGRDGLLQDDVVAVSGGVVRRVVAAERHAHACDLADLEMRRVVAEGLVSLHGRETALDRAALVFQRRRRHCARGHAQEPVRRLARRGIALREARECHGKGILPAPRELEIDPLLVAAGLCPGRSRQITLRKLNPRRIRIARTDLLHLTPVHKNGQRVVGGLLPAAGVIGRQRRDDGSARLVRTPAIAANRRRQIVDHLLHVGGARIDRKLRQQHQPGHLELAVHPCRAAVGRHAAAKRPPTPNLPAAVVEQRKEFGGDRLAVLTHERQSQMPQRGVAERLPAAIEPVGVSKVGLVNPRQPVQQHRLQLGLFGARVGEGLLQIRRQLRDLHVAQRMTITARFAQRPSDVRSGPRIGIAPRPGPRPPTVIVLNRQKLRGQTGDPFIEQPQVRRFLRRLPPSHVI